MEQHAMSLLQIVNKIVPYLGLFMCAIIMFSNKYCTNRKSTSTLIVMQALIWLGVMWADVTGTLIPSFIARLLLISFMIALMLDLHSNTKRTYKLKCKIRDLKESNSSN